ncbi:MAG: spore cortex biosynthesis protein YabQ [Romboutsia sp.]|uniref:spore cortex biosynthesis protein YabQ n=1 Tax=Romboutsia sp. TaxID=1965302 RepID=UPI003F30CDA7
MPFTEDFIYFFATIYGGIIIGLLFDFYRASKQNSKIMQKCSLILDVLFWIIATIIIFITINAIESFELRYYHFVALFIGFILYYNTVSKFILTIINKIISFITNLFKKTIQYIVSISENLYYVIAYSLHLLFDIIFYIPNMILATSRFIKRKSVRKLKIKKRV